MPGTSAEEGRAVLRDYTGMSSSTTSRVRVLARDGPGFTLAALGAHQTEV